MAQEENEQNEQLADMNKSLHDIAEGIGTAGTNVANNLGSIANDVSEVRQSGLPVSLLRTRTAATPEILTWRVIENSTQSLLFDNYRAFMDYVLCNDDSALKRLSTLEQNKIMGVKTSMAETLAGRRFLPYTDTEGYRLLKVATEAFLVANCGVELRELLSENEYQSLLQDPELAAIDAGQDRDGPYTDAPAWWRRYQVLVNGNPEPVLPYLLLIRRKFPEILDRDIKRDMFAALALPANRGEVERCYGILAEKLLHPCMVELIWSYWMEQGMLVQTMNAVNRRFQNLRSPVERDPLAMMELDPLRPLNNLLWGYVQDEQHRLSLVRRAHEYDHHYGLNLEGKAVPEFRPADSRTRFLEAFHVLLNVAAAFYRQDDDTTVIADGYPLLNALRDVHLILSEGAHNQFGDLPTTARIEMLMEQWLLARPEFREVLPTRVMVAYPEPWMDRVDAMKRLQGWTDTSISHFRFLAIYGEEILLSIRFTAWSAIQERQLAALWARFFRNQIQGYMHAYRAVTGVDLAADMTTTQQRELITTNPSVLLRQRLQSGTPQPSLPPPSSTPRFRERRPAAGLPAQPRGALPEGR